METSQAKWFTLTTLVPKRLDQQDHFKVSLTYIVNGVPTWINNMTSCPRASKPTHKQKQNKNKNKNKNRAGEKKTLQAGVK